MRYRQSTLTGLGKTRTVTVCVCTSVCIGERGGENDKDSVAELMKLSEGWKGVPVVVSKMATFYNFNASTFVKVPSNLTNV